MSEVNGLNLLSCSLSAPVYPIQHGARVQHINLPKMCFDLSPTVH